MSATPFKIYDVGNFLAGSERTIANVISDKGFCCTLYTEGSNDRQTFWYIFDKWGGRCYSRALKINGFIYPPKFNSFGSIINRGMRVHSKKF